MNWNEVRKHYEESSDTLKQTADKFGLSYKLVKEYANVEMWKSDVIKQTPKQVTSIKYLPDEIQAIIKDSEELDSLDLLYNAIMIQYATIVRGQTVMYADGVEMHEQGTTEFGVTYHVTTAQEKHKNLLTAQSTAMTVLMRLIDKFMALADETDIRKAKLKALTGNQNTGVQINIFDEWGDGDDI